MGQAGYRPCWHADTVEQKQITIWQENKQKEFSITTQNFQWFWDSLVTVLKKSSLQCTVCTSDNTNFSKSLKECCTMLYWGHIGNTAWSMANSFSPVNISLWQGFVDRYHVHCCGPLPSRLQKPRDKTTKLPWLPWHIAVTPTALFTECCHYPYTTYCTMYTITGCRHLITITVCRHLITITVCCHLITITVCCHLITITVCCHLITITGCRVCSPPLHHSWHCHLWSWSVWSEEWTVGKKCCGTVCPCLVSPWTYCPLLSFQIEGKYFVFIPRLFKFCWLEILINIVKKTMLKILGRWVICIMCIVLQ